MSVHAAAHGAPPGPSLPPPGTREAWAKGRDMEALQRRLVEADSACAGVSARSESSAAAPCGEQRRRSLRRAVPPLPAESSAAATQWPLPCAADARHARHARPPPSPDRIHSLVNELATKGRDASELSERLVAKTKEVEEERRRRKGVEDAYSKVREGAPRPRSPRA